MKTCIRCGNPTPQGFYVEQKIFFACRECLPVVKQKTDELLEIRRGFLTVLDLTVGLTSQARLDLKEKAKKLLGEALEKLGGVNEAP